VAGSRATASSRASSGASITPTPRTTAHSSLEHSIARSLTGAGRRARGLCADKRACVDAPRACAESVDQLQTAVPRFYYYHPNRRDLKSDFLCANCAQIVGSSGGTVLVCYWR
jgi:hypothetical protein